MVNPHSIFKNGEISVGVVDLYYLYYNNIIMVLIMTNHVQCSKMINFNRN